MKKISILIVLLIILFFWNSVFAEEKLRWYKLIGVKNYEIYYWIWLNWDQNINYNWKSFSWFTDIPDEPLLTDTWKVIMIGEKNWEFLVILDWNIIFTWKIEQLKIEKWNNETIFYINSKKYVVIKDLKWNLEKMTNEDFEKLETNNWNNKSPQSNIDNTQYQSNQTTDKNTQILEKSKYLKQKIISISNLKKAKQEKYITQLDKIGFSLNEKKLIQVFEKIKKLNKKNDVINYLEAVIYLKINEDINLQELNNNIEQKNNETSLVKEAQEFDKINNINRVYWDEKDNILKSIDNKRNIIWWKEWKDSLYWWKLDDIIIVVWDMSNYGKSDTKQTLEFLWFQIQEINWKNFNKNGSPKIIDWWEWYDILFVTWDIDLSKTDIKWIEEVIIH